MGEGRIPGECGRQGGPLRFLCQGSSERDPRGGDILLRPIHHLLGERGTIVTRDVPGDSESRPVVSSAKQWRQA
jgi:hypothetical protein